MNGPFVLVAIVIVGQTLERLVFFHALGDVALERVAFAERRAHLFPDVFA